MRLKLPVLFIFILICSACGPGKEEKLRNGVTFAKSALQMVGPNSMATAYYASYVGNGKGPAAYVNAMLPKTDPPFDSFENTKPTHPWTVVIRPSGAPNELSIEGYGLDLKKPLVVEYITLSLREE